LAAATFTGSLGQADVSSRLECMLVSDPKPSLARAIRTQFAPTLRGDSFSGTGQRYWRVVGGQCQVVGIQRSQYGGQFAVNLAIQPMSVPLVMGAMPQPKRMGHADCLFRRRLAISGSDQWWGYEPNQASMDAAVRAACGVYEQVGRKALDFMAKPD